MLNLIFSSIGLAILCYCYAVVIKRDNKRMLVHRLLSSQSKMEALYLKLEELIFLRNYSDYVTRDGAISYDLYLSGTRYQNDIFERELHELQHSKFSKAVEKRFNALLEKHDRALMTLQSEIYRVEHTHLFRPHGESQLSA